MNKVAKGAETYSDEAHKTFRELDARVEKVFLQIKEWRGWKFLHDPNTPREDIVRFIREIFRSVVMYQAHTTEAGFHMFGRLPKGDVRLIQALCGHKAEEAEHGIWAAEDHQMLEEPLGYLGAEYLFEELTALVTAALLPLIKARDLPTDGFRFIIEHATEDAKHAVFIKHLILDVATRYPESPKAMFRCFDYFHHVYPLPVWDEAFERAISPSR
jgi:hypothetical protein